MMFSPFGEMARGCFFGAGCLIGVVALALLALLFLGVINIDWVIGWVRWIFG